MNRVLWAVLCACRILSVFFVLVSLVVALVSFQRVVEQNIHKQRKTGRYTNCHKMSSNCHANYRYDSPAECAWLVVVVVAVLLDCPRQRGLVASEGVPLERRSPSALRVELRPTRNVGPWRKRAAPSLLTVAARANGCSSGRRRNGLRNFARRMWSRLILRWFAWQILSQLTRQPPPQLPEHGDRNSRSGRETDNSVVLQSVVGFQPNTSKIPL